MVDILIDFDGFSFSGSPQHLDGSDFFIVAHSLVVVETTMVDVIQIVLHSLHQCPIPHSGWGVWVLYLQHWCQHSVRVFVVNAVVFEQKSMSLESALLHIAGEGILLVCMGECSLLVESGDALQVPGLNVGGTLMVRARVVVLLFFCVRSDGVTLAVGVLAVGFA